MIYKYVVNLLNFSAIFNHPHAGIQQQQKLIFSYIKHMQ